MPDDDTLNMSESGGAPREDPLGIIGWLIGGKYKIRSYIGGGGFGEVYDGYNVNLVEQRLVIKFFKRVQARDRFDREAKILCMLDHPNISRVVDYLPDEGALVIHYIDGKDGGEMLRESGPLPSNTLLAVARALTGAIAYAHERKVAHRDIKPGNIIVDHKGHVYVIDFGIAKEIGGTATKTGYQALTPMFAAPERQMGDKAYNPFLSDIYEIGITLFNFATNSMPYRNPVAPNVDEWGGAVARRLSPAFRRILKKATHPDPNQRYQSVAEMAEDLRHLEQVYTGTSRKPILIGVTAVVLAVAVFFGATAIRNMLSPAGKPSSVSESDQTSGESPADTGELGTQQAGAAGDTTAGADSLASVVSAGQTGLPGKPEQQVAQEEAPPVEDKKPSPRLRVQVRPKGIKALLVDGKLKTSGRAFDVEPGSHQVTVVHPQYPILKKTIRVSDKSRDITYDMDREFATADTVNIQAAILPFSKRHLLELTLNGRKRVYTSFPVMDLSTLAGDWQIKVDVLLVDSYAEAAPKVDSIVTFPHGGGPRHKVRGAEDIINLTPGESGSAIPLLIYWSE